MLVVLLAGCNRGAQQGWSEHFDDARELGRRWIEFGAGDIRSGGVSVDRGRLAISLDTVGTDDSTIKVRGLRSREPIASPATVSVVIDWNAQANGSYLSAGVVLSPVESDLPLDADEWIRLEYIGVPPGIRGRLEVSANALGRQRLLFDDGWPAVRRQGRPLASQRVEIAVAADSLEVRENGVQLFRSSLWGSRRALFLYAFVTSHSNYPQRSVYFDDIAVQRGLRRVELNGAEH